MTKIFQNIFSINNDDAHKVLCILGIKLRFYSCKNEIKLLKKENKALKDSLNNVLKKTEKVLELDRTELKKYVNNKFRTRESSILHRLLRFTGPSNELISRCEFLNQSNFNWEHLDNKVWVIYINALLNLGREDEALNMLRKYSYYYPELEDIQSFLRVAHFAYQNGFCNGMINKSAIAYEKIEDAKRNNLLREMLNNKTIAIVGNSPCELGNGKGSEIDSHDIIIRFNNFETKGYESDYGSRTDIWCCNMMPDINARNEKFKMIVLPESVNVRRIDRCDIIYDAHEKGIPVYCYDDSLTHSLTNSVFYSPTFGLRLIYGLSHILDSLQNVDFYGFNFCSATPDSCTTHYFNDRDNSKESKRWTIHNLTDESAFMKELIMKNKSEVCLQ